MNVGVIERVIVLRARSDAARFTVARQREDVEIRNADAIGFMIAERRPEPCVPEQPRIDIENGALIFFVGTDRPEINAARVARRVLQGGHEVPIRKIIDRWGHSIANAASVAAEVNRFYVYDNSVDDRDAQLVLRAADGRVMKAYGDAPTWTGPILERLAPRES